MTDKSKRPDPQPKKADRIQKSGFSIKPHLLSWAVFVPTVVIVFLSIIPVVFPALISRTTGQLHADVFSPDVINPFQPGVLAAPLVIISIIILVIGTAYYKKSKCEVRIRKIANFEISKKQALIGVIIILAIFGALTAGTLAKEETWVDYANVKSRVQSWDVSQFGKSFEPHFKYLLLSVSLHTFGNIRILPFLVSMALLLQTYFFTKKITGKRFAGIVSMVLLLQSDIFVSYSTTASYENSWILLYLFSLYMITKFWPPSPAPYLLSLFSKPLTLAFFPMSLYFIARSTLSKRSKIYSLASYGIVGIIVAVAASAYQSNLVGTAIAFDASQFWQGFSSMAMQMRFDYIVVLFLLPLTVMLFFASRKGILHADSILIFILVILLTSPFLTGFTQQTNQPYRFVSLSVFFAIGAGILFSSKTRKQSELSSST
ncbi:MAG: hypothetical protein KGH88_08780 [Thaumarchaeota archaeon]|nr:hypothetical protein [Nitrososphaerota archaeon]